mgnify:FL=1
MCASVQPSITRGHVVLHMDAIRHKRSDLDHIFCPHVSLGKNGGTVFKAKRGLRKRAVRDTAILGKRQLARCRRDAPARRYGNAVRVAPEWRGDSGGAKRLQINTPAGVALLFDAPDCPLSNLSMSSFAPTLESIFVQQTKGFRAQQLCA